MGPLIESRAIAGEAPQSIDLLDQILADLAVCVAGLADGLPDGTQVISGPMLARLRLEDVRRRLAGGEPRGTGNADALLF